MQVEELLAKLEGVKKLPDGSWMAKCPGHDDTNPSLHISVVGGRILLYDHGGCSYEKLRSLLRLDHANEEDWALIQAQYDYLDEEGRFLYQVVRLFPKSFRCRRKTETGEWVWNMDGVRRVLYHLPEVMNAETVFVVEGEKDADALMRLGLVATTNPHGAGKWRPEYSQALKGKTVYIIPDNDEPGRAHALQVAASLFGSVKSLRLVFLPVPEHGDVSDYLQSHSKDDLLKLCEESEEWMPSDLKAPRVEGALGTYKLSFEHDRVEVAIRSVRLHSDGRLTAELRIRATDVNRYLPVSGMVNLAAPRTRGELAKALEEARPTGRWASILEEVYTIVSERERSGQPAELIRPGPITSPSFLVEPLLLEGLPTVLFGPGKTGKTLLAMAISKMVKEGREIEGLPFKLHKSGPVLYLDWESSRMAFEMVWRKLVPQDCEIYYRSCALPLYDDLQQIQDLVLEINPVLIVLDSAALAAGGELNSAESATSLYRAIKILGRTTLIVAHCPKSGASTVIGSTYFTNLARSVWEIRAWSEPGEDELRIGLAQRYSNLTGLHPAFGVRVNFFPDRIEFSQCPLSQIPEAERLESLANRVLLVLGGEGKMTIKEIAERVEAPYGTVKMCLTRLLDQGKVYRLDRGCYGKAERIPF